MSEIHELQKMISEFSKTRAWDKFHTPKNLALALGSEVGELMAEFRWKSDEELLSSDELNLKKIRYELADIAIFLLQLYKIMNIDMEQSIKDKILFNSTRNFDGPNFHKP